MLTTRLVGLDDPIAASLARKISPQAKSSTVAIVVSDENGQWLESLAVQKLDWDTRVLGLRTGRIVDVVARDDHGAAMYPGLAAHFEAMKLDYVTVRRPIREWARLRSFEAAGFRIIDGILSFSKSFAGSVAGSVSPATMPPNVRLATPRDEDAVAAIAVATFKRSRFHNDDVIAKSAADKLHEEWARNSCRGEAAKAVLVIEEAGRVGGFITCKISEPTAAQGSMGVIDLVGVSPVFAGKGFGRSLVEAACSWFASNGCAGVRVQTQADNFIAIRLYASTGFVPDATFITLRWSAREESKR